MTDERVPFRIEEIILHPNDIRYNVFDAQDNFVCRVDYHAEARRIVDALNLVHGEQPEFDEWWEGGAEQELLHTGECQPTNAARKAFLFNAAKLKRLEDKIDGREREYVILTSDNTRLMDDKRELEEKLSVLSKCVKKQVESDKELTEANKQLKAEVERLKAEIPCPLCDDTGELEQGGNRVNCECNFVNPPNKEV